MTKSTNGLRAATAKGTRYLFVYVVFSVLAPTPAGGATGFAGQVTMEDGTTALGSVTVQVVNPADDSIVTGMATNGLGYYSLTALAPGTYHIQTATAGYFPGYRSSHTVVAGQNLTVNFALQQSGEVWRDDFSAAGSPAPGWSVYVNAPPSYDSNGNVMNFQKGSPANYVSITKSFGATLSGATHPYVTVRNKWNLISGTQSGNNPPDLIQDLSGGWLVRNGLVDTPNQTWPWQDRTYPVGVGSWPDLALLNEDDLYVADHFIDYIVIHSAGRGYVKGAVTNLSAAPLANTRVELLKTGVKINEALTDSLGNYEMWAATAAAAYTVRAYTNGGSSSQGALGITALAQTAVNLALDTVQSAGCGYWLDVTKTGGDYQSIQSAMNALPVSLSTNTCVIIRDTQTYSEQVTVQGFTTNGFRLKIMADPTFVSSAPVVNPPPSSVAAFQIATDSVSVQGINIISTNTVAYGIFASSANISISSVVINGGAYINAAGVYLSSWSVVSNANISVQAAHGVRLQGGNSSVSQSTVAASDLNYYPLYFVGSSSNTVTAVNVSNTTGWAAYLSAGSNSNTISQSTIASSGGQPAIYFSGASSNTLNGNYIYNSIGPALTFAAGSNYNNADQNIITGNGITSYALQMSNSSSNTVSGGFISNTAGFGAYIYNNSKFNTITHSTITCNGTGSAGLYLNNTSSNTFMDVYVQGSTGAIIQGSTGTIIGGSTFVSTWTGGVGINLRNGSVNLTLSSTTLAGGPQGMGLYLNLNNSGTLALSSNTIAGGSYGLYIDTQSAGAVLSITSMTFASLTAGATAINFLGGQFVSTFTGVAFSTTNIAVNVNGSGLGPGARITMRSAAGSKAGPLWEKDPYGYIDWPDYACTTRTSAGSGLWSAFSTWDVGEPPTACNPVVIAAGHTVTVDTMTAVSSGTVINGTLEASRVNSSSWTLTGGDIVVNPGGTLDYGTDASPMPETSSATIVLASGTYAGQYGLIVNNGGNFTVRGVTKTPYAYATGDITTAVTNFTVYGSTSVTGWQSGDSITIGPTSGSGPATTDIRTISSISGGPSFTVNWSGGTLPQVRSIADGPIIISNLTRNVVVRSSGTNTAGDTAYIRDLARNATSFALAYGEFAYLGANVSGKYGIMFDGPGTRGEISSSTVRNGYHGIYLDNSSDNALDGNTLYANFGYGIYLRYSDRNTLARNNAHAGAQGIQTSVFADNNTVTGNNTYSNSGTGFYVQGCTNNTFAGNNVYSNSSGILLLNADNHILTGNNFYANSTAISLTRADNNTFAGNNVYSNTNNGIDIDDSSGNNFAAGKLGYNAAGEDKPNITEITFTQGKTEDLVLMDTRLNPTSGVSVLGLNTTGSYLLSYNQDFDTGTVRLWGNYQLAGSTLTLDYAARLYASTATAPKLMRGAGHSASVVSTYDSYAVSQLVTIRFDITGPYWRVEGSSSGLLNTFTGSILNQPFPPANAQFYLTFNEVAPFDGDMVDFALIAASSDTNKQKKLLFGPGAATLNNGRSKLEVSSTGGLVLRGKNDGTANTLIDRLNASSTYYTFVDSGAFTAEFSSFTNMDPDGIQLSGSAGVAISSSTFDYLGFASGTNAYITARDLTSTAGLDSVAFRMSRSSAGYDSAYNVRVVAPDASLNWTFTTPTGGRWGENYDSDPGARIAWLNFTPFPGCASGVTVKQDGSGDYTSIQAAVDAADQNLTADSCVVILDGSTYSEQVTVQGFTTNGFRLIIAAHPTLESSPPVVNPPAASGAGFLIRNDSVTVQGVNIVSTNPVSYGILASSANVNISSVTIDGGTNISVAGVSLSSWSSVSNSSITVGNAYGIRMDNGIFNTIGQSTITCNSGVNSALYLNGASSNTVTDSYIYNPLSAAVWIESGASFNTISQSVITTTGAAQPAFVLETAFSNTLTASDISSPNGIAVRIFNGASDNTISQSTVTSNQGAYAALFMATTSSNTVSGSVISNPAGEGAHLENGANSNTISQSTIASNSNNYALYLVASASNTVTGSYISNPLGYGVYMVGNSSHNVISQSTVTSGALSYIALYLTDATSNTITGSYISNPSGYGAWLDSNANNNTISQSTIATNHTSYRALYLNGASSNTVSGSVISNPGGRAVYLKAGANANTISYSSVTSADLNYAAFTIDNSVLNTATYLNIDNPSGNAMYLLNAGSNTISYSTMSTVAFGYLAFYAESSSSNTLTRSYLSSPNGDCVTLQASNNNTISYSTMTSNTNGYAALYVNISASNTVSGSYVQGSTAVYISGSTGTVIRESVLVATNTAGYALRFADGSVSLALSSSTLSGGQQGAGIYLARNNSGVLDLSSNTIAGGKYGLNIDTQSAGAVLSVTSMTFQNLTAGATAINFLGGQFVSTFTKVAFNDAGIGINVNGSQLDPGSSIVMSRFFGVKGGALYENDPLGYVDWGTLPAGCGAGANVSKAGAPAYTTIQAAIDDLSASLDADTCVVIRDTQTYSEQVTVQGFTTNGYRLTIMADPTFVSSAPTVNPPVASTAAFQIMNASVTLQGIMVVTTNTVPYGILSSSASVAVSSVMVDGGAGINVAGIALSSWDTLSNSLISVQDANAVYLPNNVGTSVADSTAQVNSGTLYALYILNGSSNTFTRGVLRNLTYMGARVYNSSFNQLSQSTVTASSTAILFENNADSNTVTGSSVTSSANDGVAFLGSNYNTVSQSTVTGSATGFWFASGAASNTVTQSVINGLGGYGAYFSDSARFNIISYSDLSNNSPVFATVIFSGTPGTEYSNTVTRSFIANAGNVAAQFEPGVKWNTISDSTVTAGGSGVYFNASSSNTVTNSYVRGSTGVDVSGSTGAVINSSVLETSDSAGSALRLRNGSLNLSVSSNTITGGSLAPGVYLAGYNSGTIDLSSNTITGGAYGLNIDTQNAGAALSITSMTFASLTAGATAINFLGGQFVSTFTGVSFDDVNIGVNVNGAPLSPGSRIRILGYAGSKRGPAFENDPYGYIDWGYAPAAVADLAVTVLSTGNVSLNWTAPGEDGMTGVLNNSTFTIQFTSVAVDAQNPVFWSTATPSVIISTTGVAPGTAQYYPLSGLNANTSYYFRLWTKDEIGNYSALSNGATAATLADQPAGPQVGAVFFTSATITWTALPAAPSSATCEGYLVQASTAAGFTGTFLSSSTSDSQLASLFVGPLVEGTTYYFRVASLNWPGSPNYSGVTLSTMTLDNVPPDAVTALAGVAVASDTVNLSWPSPGNNGAVGILTGAFTIQYTSVAVDALNPVFWTTAAAQVGISTTGVQPVELQNYDIENLLSGVTYYFRLWTNDALANFSPLSNGATVIMPPNPPSAPQVLAVSSNTMSVVWTGNGIPGTSYLAEAGNDEAFTLNAVSTVTTATAYTFTGLFPNAAYFIRLKTLGDGVIDSDFVNLAATATLSAQVTAPVFVSVFATSATLSWTDGVNPEGTSYDISVSSDDFATLNYSTTTEQFTFTATALAPNTTYYFRTAALNSGGIKSDYAVFPATMTRAALPAPNAVVFSSVTTDKVEVQWLQNGNPVSVEYMLQVSTASSFTGQLDIFLGWSAWAAAVTVTPLDSGVTFYFQVKARDSLQRETAWLYLGVQRTDLGADNAPPSVIDMQGGDDTWRGDASGSYKVRFYDGGSGLSKFEVKLSTSQGLAGPPLADWTVVKTYVNAPEDTTDWQLPPAAFEAIPEGVTAYVSVQVYDTATPTPNVTVSTDVFYVIRDTTPPTITNNAVSPSGWQFTDPGVFDVNFADARSGLAFIKYSASGSAGAADGAILGWTDIDTLVSSAVYTTDWGVAFAALTGGTTNYISARAIDAAGNVTTRSDVFRIMKAAGSPIVAMASPSAAYISSAASLSGSAYGGSDGITINYVEVWLRNLGSGLYYDGAAGTFTAAAPVWLRTSGAESWTLNISTFGTVNLSSYTAVARTLDSVARYSLTYATVTFTLDQDAPSVYLSSPVALSTVSVFDVVTGTAADAGSGPAMAGVSVKRVIDGKWWDFAGRVWGSAQVSSMTPVSGGNWTFLPDAWLRGNVLSGYDYFVTAYATDGAAPANVSGFGLKGSTFTFADTVPPGAAVTVYASTDTEASLPGKLRVTWVFPGDDGNTGMLGSGGFAIQRSTFTGFSFSTASAQVNESTASIPAGSTQAYVLSGLANSTTYYLRVWTRDDAGLWSAASPEFMGVSGEGLPNEIAGEVRTALGQGITGVFVEAFAGLAASERSTYTVNGTSGSFRLTGLTMPVYRIQVTWAADGITSSVAKDGILTGYADANFTLSVTYTLGSISGTLPLSVSGRRASSFSPSGAGAVELWQNGRMIAAVRPEADGSFLISNILPGDYEIRGPGIAPLQVRLRSGENLVVRPSAETILGESVYAYPNPARARVTFRLQTEAASGKDEVNVFDITGRLVKTITHEDPAWDRSNPYNIRWVTWDFAGSKVASGVYIYKVNMRSGVTGKTKVKTGKFAIVR